MYMAVDGDVKREFDDILFRNCVMKCLLFGFNFFAIENLVELIVTGQTSFGLGSLTAILIMATVLMVLYQIEDLRRFVRNIKRQALDR